MHSDDEARKIINTNVSPPEALLKLARTHVGNVGAAQSKRGWQLLQERSLRRTPPRRWIIAVSPTTSNYAWDREKIRRSLQGNATLAAPMMITIPTWPQALGARNVALSPTNYEKFALLCADLVRVVNVELQRNVQSFQILNEVDELYSADGGVALGKLVAAVARAMKAVDPNVFVGGSGFVYGGLGREAVGVGRAA